MNQSVHVIHADETLHIRTRISTVQLEWYMAMKNEGVVSTLNNPEAGPSSAAHAPIQSDKWLLENRTFRSIMPDIC
jgi:hypothetical protein